MFVGLAGLFPQKPHEDPMLLDEEMRVPLASGLALQEDRGRTERLLLRLAIGAATERLWLSYPRIDIAETRPRVPSFYALDVMRAITGRIPNHEELQTRAAGEGGAPLAWPAPDNPLHAIDDLEHDLAVLRELLQVEPPASVRGRPLSAAPERAPAIGHGALGAGDRNGLHPTASRASPA